MVSHLKHSVLFIMHTTWVEFIATNVKDVPEYMIPFTIGIN